MNKLTKRTTYIIFVILMSVSLILSACSNNNSPVNGSEQINISLSDFETSLKDFDESLVFTTTDNGDGYDFGYDDDSMVTDIQYYGTTDKDKNVLSISIVNNDIDENVVTNRDNMESAIDLLFNDPSQMTQYEFVSTYPCTQVLAIYEAIGVEEPDLQEILDIICDEKIVEIKGFEISSSTTGSITTVSATKK